MGLLKPSVYALCVLLCLCSVQTTVLARRELKVYYVVHEIRGGPNSTVLSAAGTGQGNLTQTGWGTFLVNDNLVRESENVSSTLIGGSTGFGAVTTQLGIGGGILSVTKVSFNDASAYNASTITFTGTFATPNPPYDIIVLGGTGYFRGWTGYGIATPGLPSPPVYTTKIQLYLHK